MLDALAEARSNDPEAGDGRGLWHEQVLAALNVCVEPRDAASLVATGLQPLHRRVRGCRRADLTSRITTPAGSVPPVHEGGVPPGPGLDVRVFGPLVARRDGVELPLGGPKERAVLATLLAAEGEAVSIDGLAESVWGDDQPRSAVRTLHAYVARLRKALAANGEGADLLVTRGRSYQLVLPPDAVDAHRFVVAAALGRSLSERSDPGGALAACDRALAEWGGAAYAGHEDIERCAAAARALDEVRRGLVEDRFEALLTLGQAGELVPALESAVGEEPFRERRWGQLMVALYRAGRQADALRAFQRAREALVDALGVEPGPSCASSRRPSSPRTTSGCARRSGATTRWWRCPPRSTPPVAPWSGAARSWTCCSSTWRQLRSGRGSYVSVVGPEGIGKTRLVAELAAQAHQDGAIICFARCDPDHRSARAVFDQALRSAGSSLMRVQADARIGEPLGATIARRLGEWAATTPVLLVLDDLHEAETEVLEVVADVAGSTRLGRGAGGRDVPHGTGRGRSPHRHRAAAGRGPPRA